MVGPDGKMLFSDEFSNEPSMVINGLFHVEENDAYSVYKAAEKPQLVQGLEGLKDVGEYSEGVLPIVRPQHRIEYVNADGKTKFTLEPVDGKEIVCVQPFFMDGLAYIITEDNKWGVINPKGKVVIKPSFDFMYMFKDGYALAANKKDDDITACIINKKGEQVVKFKKDMEPVEYFVTNGTIAAKYDDRYGFLNLKGEFTKCPSKVEGIGNRNSKYYAYKSSDGDWGVMDYDGEILVRAKYNEILLLEDKIIAQKDGEAQILDSSGETLSTIDDASDIICLAAFFSTEFKITAQDRDTYTLYDLQGKQVGKETFWDLGKTFSTNVTSDFFDVNAVTTKVLNYIDDDGIAGVKIGDTASKHIDKEKDLSDYKGSMFIDGSDKVEGGYKYTASFNIYADNTIVNSEPVYKTSYIGSYSYEAFDHYDYTVNANSKICTEILQINAETDFYDDAFEPIYKGLKKKGWSEFEKTSNYAYLKKNDKAILLFPASKSQLCLAVLEDKNVYSVIDNVRGMASQLSGKDNVSYKSISKPDIDEYADSVYVEVEEDDY